jgi:hypothetical protein
MDIATLYAQGGALLVLIGGMGYCIKTLWGKLDARDAAHDADRKVWLEKLEGVTRDYARQSERVTNHLDTVDDTLRGIKDALSALQLSWPKGKSPARQKGE